METVPPRSRKPRTGAPARRVPVRYLALLTEDLRAKGVDTGELLRMAGIDEERFKGGDHFLHPDEFACFVTSLRRLTGRTDLGFEFGRLIKMNSHELLGYGMLSCRNWDEVMRLVVRHYHLMIETFTLRYRRQGGVGEAVYTPVISMPLETLRFYYEVLAVAHQNQIRLMFGPREIPGYDIYLSMPAPPHVARYSALALTRFHFEEHAAPGVRAVMGADLLDHPLPMANARVVREIDERCSTIGRRPPAGDEGWGEYVAMMLRQTQGQLLTLEQLAQRVRVSARTIDRHLKRENLQFRELANQVRFERACEMLASPLTTVAQVAQGLGFTDAANFSRAFRRMIGISPGEYQRRLGERAPS